VRRRKAEKDHRQVQENEKGSKEDDGQAKRRKTKVDRQVQENEKGYT
jgi:hypothetical protein